MQHERVTLASLGAELGLHKSTVSRALRGDLRIRAGTRQAVERLAAVRGYRPDPALSALSEERWGRRRSARSGRWALLHAEPERRPPGPDDPGFGRLYQAAAARGYVISPLSLRLTGGAAAVEARLRALDAHAALLLPVPERRLAEDFAWDQLDWDRRSWLGVGEAVWPVPLHQVRFDPFHDAHRALEGVAAHGWRRFAFVRQVTALSRVNQLQEAAFLLFQRSRPELELCDVPVLPGGPVPPALASFAPQALLLGYPALRQLLRAVERRLPWAAMALHPDQQEQAGIHTDWEQLCTQAVDWLDVHCRRRLRGLPGTRSVLQVQTPWRDGASLPQAGC